MFFYDMITKNKGEGESENSEELEEKIDGYVKVMVSKIANSLKISVSDYNCNKVRLSLFC